MRRLATIGVASGLGANIAGSEHGPALLMRSEVFKQRLREHGIDPRWIRIDTEGNGDSHTALKHLIRSTAQQLQQTVSSGEQFVVIGGDHSIAMGVWQGVMSALQPKQLGLIWIDAHLDLHTMETSVSCNVHGMPLAALLGQGDPLLQELYGSDSFLDPANLALIGCHSCEPQEIELARRLGLASFDMPAIRKRGSLMRVMQQALRLVKDSTDRYGISIDLDVLDPQDAPGVNTPEKDGIPWQELQQVLATVRNDPRLVGIEVAEFNPALDRDGCTQQVISDFIGAVFGDSSIENRSLGLSREQGPERREWISRLLLMSPTVKYRNGGHHGLHGSDRKEGRIPPKKSPLKPTPSRAPPNEEDWLDQSQIPLTIVIAT